jgi:pimeloyl-ACP methyl ester carboxylesterase
MPVEKQRLQIKSKGGSSMNVRHCCLVVIALVLLTALPCPAQLANPTTFIHHTTNVNGIRLHYVTSGRGEPVVLLHGFASTWYMWRHVAPELAKRYTVIIPDLRGAGDSAKPVGGYDKRTMAEDIYQLVRQLGHQRIFLVGHDMGFMVAYAYATAHPEDVRRLVLLEGLLPGVGVWEEAKHKPIFWHFGFHSVPNLPEALVAGRECIYLNEFWEHGAYNPAAITEADKQEYLRSYAAPGGMRAAFEYYRAFPEDERQNRESARRKLTMPVLALGGAQAIGALVLSTAQAVATNVRGGVIERCGHWIPEERPEYLTEQLLTFFGEER